MKQCFSLVTNQIQSAYHPQKPYREVSNCKDERTADAGQGEAAGKNLVLVLGETHVSCCAAQPRPLIILSGWWCMHVSWDSMYFTASSTSTRHRPEYKETEKKCVQETMPVI